MVQIALMGYGVVGSGVAEVIMTHEDNLEKHAHEEINIKYILDIREFPDSPLSDKFIRRFSKIEEDEEIKIVVETMGGLNPAYDYVKRCLEAGKSVVTSNKELVAEKGAELIKLAQENNVNFLFEASVGGGIPIIRPITQCLAANKVQQIAGILNGTTNFILTKMVKELMPLDKAVELAQKLGYAERDPSSDVDGIDACRKICILASLVFGKHFYPDCVFTEGIGEIKLADMEYASDWGGVVKLIASVKRLEDGMVDILVAPMFVRSECKLASIDDAFNGILVKGDSSGDVIFYGQGAGKLPTASAVVADVIDCAKHLSARKYIFWEDSTNDDVIMPDDSMTKMFIRMKTYDKEQSKERIEELFGEVKYLHRNGEPNSELAFVTLEDMRYGDIEDAIFELEDDGAEILSEIRIADF